ncbi:MAG: hypothetical protein KTR27_07475 [Leptolyngbyaceae cyanobacterium MAG.088]|nr:hypothetical protein [Leptolyngbyaceae cyanobacterium MAG.088]
MLHLPDAVEQSDERKLSSEILHDPDGMSDDDEKTLQGISKSCEVYPDVFGLGRTCGCAASVAGYLGVWRRQPGFVFNRKGDKHDAYRLVSE